jgi:hypothetical protein
VYDLFSANWDSVCVDDLYTNNKHTIWNKDGVCDWLDIPDWVQCWYIEYNRVCRFLYSLWHSVRDTIRHFAVYINIKHTVWYSRIVYTRVDIPDWVQCRYNEYNRVCRFLYELFSANWDSVRDGDLYTYVKHTIWNKDYEYIMYTRVDIPDRFCVWFIDLHWSGRLVYELFSTDWKPICHHFMYINIKHTVWYSRIVYTRVDIPDWVQCRYNEYDRVCRLLYTLWNSIRDTIYHRAVYFDIKHTIWKYDKNMSAWYISRRDDRFHSDSKYDSDIM